MSVYERQRVNQRRFTRQFNRRHRRESDIWFQAEALAAEKRESYLLHRNELRSRKIGVGDLYELFLVVGVPNETIDEYRDDPMVKDRTFEPKLFFQYPATESSLGSDATPFCFPNGAKLHFVRKTPSASNILELVYQSTRGLRNHSSHIFVLNTLEGYIYGICITTMNIVPDTSSESSLRKHSVFSPVCYCFLTRHPYFDYFFDLLEAIIGLEHLRLMSGDICADIVRENSCLDPEPIPNPVTSPKSKKDKRKSVMQSLPPIDVTPTERSTFSDDSLDTPTRSENARSFRRQSVVSEQWHKGTEIPVTEELTETPMKNAEEDYMKEIMGVLDKLRTSPAAASSATSKIEFSTPDNLIRSEFTVPETSDIESNLLIRWSAQTLFAKLKPKTIVKMISNILLERPIIVVCPDLRELSCIMLSIIPLLRPFYFQLPFIPILPAQLQSILEAPVPFLVGVCELKPETRQSVQKSGVVIVDTAINRVILPNKVTKYKIPQNDILVERLKPVLDGMQEPKVRSDKRLMDHYSDNIARIFTTHYEALFSRITAYSITNTSDRLHPVAVFLKDTFLDEMVSTKERGFMKHFLETQQFNEYCDRILQETVQKPRDVEEQQQQQKQQQQQNAGAKTGVKAASRASSSSSLLEAVVEVVSFEKDDS